MARPALLAGLVWTAAADADVVRLGNGQRISGTIVSYDDRELVVRLDNGRDIRYPAEEVDGIDSPAGPAEQSADAALARRDDAAAVGEFQRALSTEQRSWVRARILAKLTPAAQRAGQWEAAAEAFLLLAELREGIDVMALAPLLWEPGQSVSAEVRRIARRMIDDRTRPLARLIGGSWLLESPDGEAARTALSRLQTNKDPRWSWPARAQLWRTRLDSLTEEEIGRLAELVEKTPPPLRGGPRLLLAMATERRGKPVEAALLYLRVAFIDAPGTDLAPAAKLRAAEASRSAGLAADAEILYKELTRDHAGTPWAAAADRRLREKNLKDQRDAGAKDAPSPQEHPSPP